MSRTVARLIGGFVDIATRPLNDRQREKTLARIARDIEDGGVREVGAGAKGTLRLYGRRGSGTASAVERFGQDEPETMEWIDRWILDGHTLWDVGANIGLYSLYAGLRPGVQVFAFEPSGLNFGLLVEHIALNRLGGSIRPLCVALGDRTALEQLHMGTFEPGHASNAVGGAQTQFDSFAPVFSQTVPVFRADDFCRVFGVNPPDHIKLDVDGIEDRIIAGMENILPQVRTITIEVEGRNAEQAAETIEAPLRRAGFEEDRGHREKGSRRNRLYINRKRAA